MVKEKPFKVPVKKIDNVVLCATGLTHAKGKSHDVQFVSQGKTVNGTTWARWADTGTPLKISGQANGFITHLKIQTSKKPRKTLTAHDYSGTGQFGAWGHDPQVFTTVAQNITTPGYIVLAQAKSSCCVAKAHQNGLVKLADLHQHLPISAVPVWSYKNFPASRRKNLEKKYTPQSLVDDLVAWKPKIISFDFEEATDGSLKGYSRANIVIDVGSDFFDQLYNGAAGIRGQHYLDPVFANAGERLRNYFVRQWLHQLASYMDTLPGWQTHKGRLRATRVAWSIMNERAKIWQVEEEPDLGQGEQLHIKRWASYQNTKAGDPICDFLELDAGMVQSWVQLGMDAPLKKQIRLMGHWINKKFKFAPASALPKRKRQRDKQVSYLGFS